MKAATRVKKEKVPAKAPNALFSHWSELLLRGSREGALLSLFFLAVYVGLSLVTYQKGDPGWTTVGRTDQVVHNAGGPAGAWLADVLFSLFGILAFLVPVLIAFRAWKIFRRKETHKRIWPLFFTRNLGLVLTMAGAAGLAFLHLPLSLESLPELIPDGKNPAGGVMGIWLGEYGVQRIGPLGTTLVLLIFMLTGLTIFTDVSWIRAVDVTGAKGLTLAQWLARGVVVPFTKWKSAAAEKIAARAAARSEAIARKQGLAGQGAGGGGLNVSEPVLIRRNRKDGAEKAAGVNAGGALERREPEITFSKAAGEGASEREVRASSGSIAANAGSIAAKFLGKKAADAVEPASVRAKPNKPKPFANGVKGTGEGELPSASLLDGVDGNRKKGYTAEALEMMSRLLESKLRDFGIEATVENVLPGPVVTRFEIQPAPGIKVSRISNLAKDLARSLAVISVRVVEVIPGKTYVGIEIPNENREMIRLSEIITADEFVRNSSPLTLALGKDISGRATCADLAKMPHLLVAGTTGSGKSVGLNAMILSMLFKSTPAELRLIMIDPKMLELSVYDGIPHLLTPVVTDMKEAANALRWCVGEMERRYRLMAAMGVRNLAGYNRKIKDAEKAGTPISDPFFKPVIDGDQAPDLSTLPFVVVVIDEFADMMMIVGKKVEELIARIAQKARAAGIHLLLATQRPSVDVITGLIKANIPSRIGFQVSSKIDSRTILDQGGADQLLGNGDMLYLPPGSGIPVRVHGAFVDDDEVHRVCSDWRLRGEPDYLEDILQGGGADSDGFGFGGEGGGTDGGDPESDPLYDEALRFVTETRKASISSVQRKLKIGYNRAARLIESMEMAGVVSSMQSNGSREVLAPPPVHMD
ncbi:Cell division transmembrane protein [gamma proteobacterium HdN1]|nr:Cell division transmembrane protein [gamma proteobacterium HdN1]